MEYLPGMDVANKPDVIARVFKLKLDQLLYLIKNKNYFGKCIGGITRTLSSMIVVPVYRRRRTEASVLKKGVLLDNQYVVPYNRDLLLRFHCHINVEVCNSSRSLKYLFKYCLKGHNTTTMLLRKKNKKNTPDETTTKVKSTDEIKNFLDGRYICVSEAAWRLLGFDIHHRFPSVERLTVHMEDEKSVSFKPHDDLGDVAERAKI
ncbi:uncharacterized protein LOC141685113 [Apium graveolens]|uniref:uncharacterized protein LOC141685113 n=1 Tax=Apium graveolens TaxID=4045 RepID=UPI003D78BC10